MKTKPNSTILSVAEVYGFDVQYSELLEKWIISGKSKREPVEFYWDSTYDDQNFFDELQSFFNQEGKESVLPY